jgi:SecD/SecF fusion protein
MVEQAMEAIRKRVDRFGVSEPIITPQGKDRILVQIPGLETEEKIADARETLRKVAKLEFRLVHPQSFQILNGQGTPPPDFIALPMEKKGDDKMPERTLLVQDPPNITGDKVTEAGAGFGQKGWEVRLGFSGEGSKQFADLTTAHVNQQFAIVLDGVIISAPNINEPITGGSAVISGSFKENEARGLASALQNPLQTPIVIEEERTASSSLGADAIRSGIYAGLGGLALVLVFVVIYYRSAAIVALLGLTVNIVLLFGAMGMFHFVLTLPGIAGIILTIGLAVDANVLIYERLREEMDAGKPIGVAITSAYDKAFTVIFDANATTLITAGILFWKASGPVKGFAVTLVVGVIASVFSAMIVTRVLFSWALEFGLLKKLSMLHIIPTGKNFNFLGRRRLWIGISVVVTVIGIAGFVIRGEKNFGIDFKGGDLLMLETTKQKVELSKVREVVESLKLGETVIQEEKSVNSEYITIRCPMETGPKVEQALQNAHPEAGFHQHKYDHVGNVVGKELAHTSLMAFGLGMLGILIYVWVRFELSFAIGSLVALIHDVVVTVGVFALFGHELSLVMVGAILTIAGYSINDTIVVFDRIREGLHSGRRGSVEAIMNASINETLSRTLLTSGCTFLSVAALFFFGGPVLRDFAFAILIGIVVGTYSSIFIASPIVLWWSGHKASNLRSPEPRGLPA